MVGWLAIKQSYIDCFIFNNTDFTTNYCGPYWSDGKFQSSVENPSSEPVNSLDAACREHDIAYAKAKGNIKLLNKADDKFYNETVSNKSHPIRGFIYGNAVYYGNRTIRYFDNLKKMAGVMTMGVDNFYNYQPTNDNPQKANLPSDGTYGTLNYLYAKPKVFEDNLFKGTSNDNTVYNPKQFNLRREQPTIVYNDEGEFVVRNPISSGSTPSFQSSENNLYTNHNAGNLKVPALELGSMRHKYVDKRPQILHGRYTFANMHPFKRKGGVGQRNMHKIFVG